MEQEFKIRDSISVRITGKLLKEVRKKANKESFFEPELTEFVRQLIMRGLKK